MIILDNIKISKQRKKESYELCQWLNHKTIEKKSKLYPKRISQTTMFK